MDKNELFRTEIENRIIAKLKEIQIREGPKDRIFINFDMMDDFLDECQSLVEYFIHFEDTTIDVEIVRVYADLTRYFRRLTVDSSDSEVKSIAQRWLDEIEGWMDDVIAAAARNWANLHPKD